MRWKPKQDPYKYLEGREVTFFLLFPIYLREPNGSDGWRWLERATIYQQWYAGAWHDIRFVNE